MPIFNRRGSRLTNWRDRLDNPLRVNPEPDLVDDEDDVELGYAGPVGDRDNDGDIDRRDRRLSRRGSLPAMRAAVRAHRHPDLDGDGDSDRQDRQLAFHDTDGDGDVDAEDRALSRRLRKAARVNTSGYFEDTAAKFNTPVGLLGAGVGFFFGGPVGAAVGAGLGGFLIKKAE